MNIIQLNLNSSSVEDAAQVASYLNNGTVFLVAAGLEQDAKDSAKGSVVPIGWATDGNNVWPLSVAYYVENYQIGIDNAFLSEIRGVNYQCPSVSEDQLAQIKQEFSTKSSQAIDNPQVTSGEPNANPFK